MSAALSEMPTFSEPNAICLPKNGIFFGILSDIIEPDGEDFVLACMEGSLVAAPKALGPELWKLRSERVILANVAGKLRAEVAT
jgi:hypothetical protein